MVAPARIPLIQRVVFCFLFGAIAMPATAQQQPTDAAPERLIDDSLADPDKIAAARQKMEQPPPQTDDPARLSTFFYERGLAAMTAGSYARAVKDLNAAAEQAARDPGLEASFIWEELARAYMQSGRPISAVKAIQNAIATSKDTGPARTVGLKAFLVAFQSAAGDLSGAEKALAEIKQLRGQAGGQRGGGNPRMQNRIELSVLRAEADMLEARGKYQEAEPPRRKAVSMAEALPHLAGPPTVSRIMALARNLNHQGRYGEAETEIRRALIMAQKHSGASGFYTGIVLQALAQTLLEQGRLADAEALANKAQEIASASGAQTGGAVIAGLFAAQGRWAEAAAQFDRIQKAREPEDFEAFVRRQPAHPLVMVKTGRAEAMLPRLEAQLEESRRALGDKHFATAEARGVLAMALAQTGNPGRALAEFAAALPILTSASRAAEDGDGGQSARDHRVRTIIEAYMDLLASQHSGGGSLPAGLDPVATTFTLAESARGRDVQRALSASAARAAAGNPDLAALVRNLQDAEKQIAALNALLANAISSRADEQQPATTNDLRVRIDKLRDERGRLSTSLEQRFPEFAGLINPKPASTETVRAALRPGETLVSFYSGDNRTYVWAISAGGPTAFHAAPIGKAALAEQVARLRGAMEPAGDTIDSVPSFDAAAAHQLYAALLAPLGPAVTETKHMLVVPHGALGQLPLGLLVTAPAAAVPPGGAGQPAFAGYRQIPWLIRRTAITQLPASAALATLRALPPGPADRQPFLGFGDPWFSPAQAAEGQAVAQLAMRGGKLKLRSAPPAAPTDQLANPLGALPRLPETADEVRGIAAALRADVARDVRLGKAAARSIVQQSDLARHRVVMFATHGLIPGELDGLDQPALALSAAEVTGVAGDGLLTAADILSLKLNADWVILSACNTAAGSGAGSEAVSGLGRAFFYAGTRALLVSNWPVETSSAAALTTDLFRRQAADPQLGRAEALRQAMLALIDGPGAPDFTYAHPIFWAPFSLVGDGG